MCNESNIFEGKILKYKCITFDNLQGGHFFGVELYSGHLYLHLNLGTGHIKIRVSHRFDVDYDGVDDHNDDIRSLSF